MPNQATQSDNRSFSQLWKENHGNLLVGVLAIILLIGITVLIWPGQHKVKDPFLIPNVSLENEDSEGMLDSDTTENYVGPDTSLLMVKILGLSNNRGVVRVAVYDSPTSFNVTSEAAEKAELQIQGTEAIWEVKVPANKPVAIAAYHDQNMNGQLDKNIIGLPIEKYGFSMGERGPRGPPKFEQASFTPPAGIVEVPIQVW